MAFARAVGEYGSVIFIAGNMPMVSEITPLIIIGKLEQYDYAGATAVAVVMLVHLVRAAAGHQRAAGLAAQRDAGGTLHERCRAHAIASTRQPWHHAKPPWVRCTLIGIALVFFAAVPGAAAGRRVHRGAAQGLRRLPRGADGARRLVGDPADADHRGHRRAAEPGVRRRRRLGDRQVRVPRQGLPDHADRPAVLGVAGGRRPDLRADVRRAGLVRALAARRTTSRSSSPCPASCWPRSS